MVGYHGHSCCYANPMCSLSLHCSLQVDEAVAVLQAHQAKENSPKK